MALPIVLIAAIADNGVIGDDNRLIWRLKTDLRRFRSLTLGRPVLMGRKTFLSIGKPLPGRETIVLTRDAGFRAEGVHVAHSLGEGLEQGQRLGAAMGADSVVVAGGADVYAQALPVADRLELTLVHAEPGGDAVFPEWGRAAFDNTSREDHPADADNEHSFTFATYRRRD
ncbi:dihydrofolate reductase [Bosea caraganae]|uniref:Dihydrofolate reductase n=1 Tax=Bosea caraganae TaxID=2763117 RepID=A0A370LBD9_9HYPH|nr:dihydrofolate reductase [Bosea caraganae]RDJ27133.1 dihydrofolate reductase [Bosea caraganae]RDJ29150.1 dihydrofolate reductase [Bosea caraganae]